FSIIIFINSFFKCQILDKNYITPPVTIRDAALTGIPRIPISIASKTSFL
ncbi:unnamed protein product, partial [marine sediment metagenome]